VPTSGENQGVSMVAEPLGCGKSRLKVEVAILI